MTGFVIASVVEGHGEVKALPILIRRIANELYGVHELAVTPPHRLPRSQMIKGDMLARAVRVQAARIDRAGGVLVTADADDDCALELRGQLRAASAPVPVEVTIAVREFESWFLAALPSLTGHRSFNQQVVFDGDPELKRDAKGVLSQFMTECYRETLIRRPSRP